VVQARRITQVSELGLDKIKRIQGIRLIHPSHYGRICPIETGEGMSAGIVMAMASNTRITSDGELEAPHQPVSQGVQHLSQPWEYLLAQDQFGHRVAQFDVAHAADGTLLAPQRPERGGPRASATATPDTLKRPESVTMTHLGLFGSCSPAQVEYVACGAPISVAVGLIPFVEHDDANRALMGAKHQQQAVPTLWPERPVVGSGMEAQVATYSARTTFAGVDGHVLYCDAAKVVTVSCAGIVQVSEQVQNMRQSLRAQYFEREQLSQWIRFDDFYELCARLPYAQLQQLYNDVIDSATPNVQKIKQRLQDWSVRAGINPSRGSFMHSEGVREEAPLPAGWVETEYCIQTQLMHHLMTDCASTKKHTLAHDTVTVRANDAVCSGDIIAEGQGVAGGELALGKNLVVAYMPYEGYNYEDAIVISERCVREDILTSVHIEELTLELDEDLVLRTPDWYREREYMSNGMAREGAWLEGGDVAICVVRANSVNDANPDKPPKPRTITVPDGIQGRVIDASVWYTESVKFGRVKKVQVAKVLLAVVCRIQVGDKLSGRHGNKGIVSKIVPVQDMPYLPDGTPVDICLNPLGVPSRMNVGQIFENILGSAGRWNGEEYRVGSFDEMFAEEASRGLVFEAMRRAQIGSGNKWLLVYDSIQKAPIRGISDRYMMAGTSSNFAIWCGRAERLVWPDFVVITQQPIKGRSRGGGLRLGEMEVSALIGHGAGVTLQELLTVKSDDLQGRQEIFRSLSQGQA
ncbi:rpoB, partial [Symbiodinium necroappetens]